MKLPWSGKKETSDIAQSDQKLSTEYILGTIEDGVVMVGEDNILHLFNKAASKITGWPVTEALGLDYRSVLTFADEHGNPQGPDKDPFAKVLSSHATVRDNKIM